MGNLIPTLEWLPPPTLLLLLQTVKQLSPFIKLTLVMLDQQLSVFDPRPFYVFVIVLASILLF